MVAMKQNAFLYVRPPGQSKVWGLFVKVFSFLLLGQLAVDAKGTSSKMNVEMRTGAS
jgi:hypothetical protein